MPVHSDSGAPFRLRHARRDDASEIAAMVRELAVFEREPLASVKITQADVLRDCFGERPRAEVLIAERQGRIAGFALYFHNYSTWMGRAGLYLEDIFVRDWARGNGVGRLLMAGIARIAKERGCPRLDLWVLHWNPARAFYEKLGMIDMSDWRPYRLEAAGIERLAEEAGDGSWHQRP
jgi:GNAT superfamily N-acetyltransferase